MKNKKKGLNNKKLTYGLRREFAQKIKDREREREKKNRDRAFDFAPPTRQRKKRATFFFLILVLFIYSFFFPNLFALRDMSSYFVAVFILQYLFLCLLLLFGTSLRDFQFYRHCI